MTHLQAIHSELAYLRALHAAAVSAGLTEIAFGLTWDIADLVAATEVLERRCGVSWRSQDAGCCAEATPVAT